MPAPTCRIAIKAVPNASRDEIGEWLGDALKVKLRAPALEGRANEALCEFLAERLGLPRRQVVLVRGEKSRQKVIALTGLTLAEARTRLTGTAQ